MKLLQIDQPQTFEMLIEASPFRRSKGSLTAPAQMPCQPTAYIPVHTSLCIARIAKRKVIGPTSQLSIDPLYQMRHRYMTLPTIDHRSKLLPLRLQRIARGGDIQVTKPTTFKITVVSERETQKIKTDSRMPKVNDLRLFPVQFQTQPSLR